MPKPGPNGVVSKYKRDSSGKGGKLSCGFILNFRNFAPSSRVTRLSSSVRSDGEVQIFQMVRLQPGTACIQVPRDGTSGPCTEVHCC